MFAAMLSKNKLKPPRAFVRKVMAYTKYLNAIKSEQKVNRFYPFMKNMKKKNFLSSY